MTEQAARLKRIIVEGLFGSRDYDLRLDATRPTVLTGANGTGKSTILRLVNAAATGDMKTFATAPVRLFELRFDETEPFVVQRAEGMTSLIWGTHRHKLELSDSIQRLPEWALDALATEERLDEDEVELKLQDVVRERGMSYVEYRNLRARIQGELGGLTLRPPEWMTEFSSVFKVLFVTDQRLVVEPESTPAHRHRPVRTRSSRLAVEQASADIGLRMQRLDTAYARASQQQDRRFPRDVIAAMQQPNPLPIESLEELLLEVEERRERLRAVGLLDTDTDYEPDIARESLEAEHVRPVIATFLFSSLEKLRVLDDLSSRLRVFKSFLDSRFGPTKKMSFSRHGGIEFEVRGAGNLAPRDLSSGEQQMMVLAYEILFRSAPGTLVIVDEPELSLHVTWQDSLVDDLVDMGEAGSLQFLMATHSGTLLAEHPNLERSLDKNLAVEFQETPADA